MIVYRISKIQFINDLSGIGAYRYPGRWNSKGTSILYTASSPSLALLESVVHLSKVIESEYALATISIPDVFYAELKPEDLEENWSIFPPPDVIKTYGDEFVRQRKYLGLKVPSSIMPEDVNYLINPAHSDFAKVTIKKTRVLAIDSRLL